jgi:2-keto-4-pentenoate hydratase/2-oxohepta-3-ene-1,7-dioic acid hydratase in catechol pathway
MKLATFSRHGLRSIGVVRSDGIVDLADGAGAALNMEAFLAVGPEAIERARRRADSGAAIPMAEVRLHAPVEQPRKFLAIAANYQSHIDEVMAGNPNYVPPTSQRWFVKLTSCINGPFDPVLMPPESSELDYEVELAVIIGRRCRRA